jgi:hypothetical protein
MAQEQITNQAECLVVVRETGLLRRGTFEIFQVVRRLPLGFLPNVRQGLRHNDMLMFARMGENADCPSQECDNQKIR